MPLFHIQTINSTFVCRDDGAEYGRAEAALAAGVRGAIEALSDEVMTKLSSSAMEVHVEDEKGAEVLRLVVAISILPLMTASHIEKGLAASVLA